jgi:hypothetical protein
VHNSDQKFIVKLSPTPQVWQGHVDYPPTDLDTARRLATVALRENPQYEYAVLYLTEGGESWMFGFVERDGRYRTCNEYITEETGKGLQ